METSLIKKDPDEINIWNRPGGNVAKIITVAACGAFFYGIYLLAPMILSVFQNLFYASAFLIGLVGLWATVTSKDFQRAWKTGFSMFCWKITGFFVKMDPIHILKRGVEKMKTKQLIVSQKIDKIQGILSGMNRSLRDTQDNFTKEKGRLEQFEARGLQKQVALSKNKIARYGGQIKNQSARIEQCEKYLKVLKELEDAVKFKVEDTENEVKVMQEEYESALAQKEAVSSIKSIMRGFGGSQEDMLASEIVWTTVNDSIGEIDRFLDGSNELLVNYGADVAAGAQKADEMIKEFEKNGFKSLTDSKQKIKAAISGEPEKIKIPMNNNSGFNYFN